MKINTFKFRNRVVKELRFSTESVEDIARAEKQKARLENEGYNLKYTNAGLYQSIFGYVKYNQND